MGPSFPPTPSQANARLCGRSGSSSSPAPSPGSDCSVDIVLLLSLPETGENEDEKLNEVMQEAWKYNRECKLLRDTLQTFSWNGEACRRGGGGGDLGWGSWLLLTSLSVPHSGTLPGT